MADAGEPSRLLPLCRADLPADRDEGLPAPRSRGLEHVPRDGGFVVAANHTSNLDPWPLGVALWPRQLHYMAKSELWKPGLRTLLRQPRGRSRSTRRGRHRGARDRGPTVHGGPGDGDVPGGDAAREGPAQEAPAPPAYRGRADRTRRQACPLVPAAIAGMDRLSRLGPAPGRLRAADRPRRISRRPIRTARRTRRPPGSGPRSSASRRSWHRRRAGDLATTAAARRGRRLLAHRAFHALPSSITDGDGRPANMLVGFADMLTRLWERDGSENDLRRLRHARARRPTATRCFRSYQSGRDFVQDDAFMEQLDRLPVLVEALGLPLAKQARLRGRRLPRRGRPRRGRGAAAPTLVVSNDRDLFQLASARTTILSAQARRVGARTGRPGRGAGTLRRRAGAGRRLHRAPRRPVRPDPGRPRDRPGEGGGAARRARLARGGARRGAVPCRGRRAPNVSLAIATVQADAPIPPLPDATPDWDGGAALADSWGLTGLANRLRDAGRVVS